jgi:hypothetical protein
MKLITERRFNALAGYAKLPESVLFIKELSWFEEGDETLLGMVGLDTIDNDYSAAVFGRDARGCFRYVNGLVSMSTQAEATLWLRDRLAELVLEPPESHYQGDEVGQAVDFFRPIIDEARRAVAFEQLRTLRHYSHALGLLRGLMYYFRDPDGHFIQQFQSDAGFDARLWELYLYATFTEAGYGFDRQHHAPDFHCRGPLGEFFVEATTVGVSPIPIEIDESNIESYHEDYIPVRFAGALRAKLQKHYWELPHVAGHPLVIAIQDFHATGSMKWSTPSLIEYLYGLRQIEDEDGTARSVSITEHRWKAKVISSNFFAQSGAENISAVIANPSGTLSKFTRMGFLAGFGDRDLKIYRRGIAFQDESGAAPTPYAVEVTAEGYDETWGEGLAVYHNPRAKVPFPEECLPNAGHFIVEDGELLSKRPAFFPLGSEMWVVAPTGETDSAPLKMAPDPK